MADVVSARIHVTSRLHATWINQSAGAGMIIASAVAFTAPTVSTMSAMSAGYLQRPRVAANAVQPTIHPNPAQGSRSTEVREMYGST